MEKIWKNLVDGLRLFCRNNGFDKVVLGLSGGLDSAITAILAKDALGAANVKTIMMKTANTSALSLEIAREIAEINGFDYQELDIEPVICRQKEFLSEAFKETPKNIVIENLQARERGKILMAYSNQYNYLVLACGNKSEIAMGYCTLYGDTCGGLAPIANLYKSDIFELAKWRNMIEKALPEKVITRAPSAELSAGQKDEDTLPPYKVLDKILKLSIDDKQTAAQIIAEGYDAVTVEWVLKRYQAQAFKRAQLAPALKF